MPTPAVIVKFAFRNRRDTGRANDPTSIDFIGSKDCTDFQVIKAVDGLEWQENDEEKVWTINDSKVIMLMANGEYNCYGIRVRSISGRWHACLQNIQMWTRDTGNHDCIPSFVVRRRLRQTGEGGLMEGRGNPNLE